MHFQYRSVSQAFFGVDVGQVEDMFSFLSAECVLGKRFSTLGNSSSLAGL